MKLQRNSLEMSFALSRFNPRVGEILSLRGLLSEGVQLHLLVTVFSKNITYGGRRRENEIEAIFTLQVSNKFLIFATLRLAIYRVILITFTLK